MRLLLAGLSLAAILFAAPATLPASSFDNLFPTESTKTCVTIGCRVETLDLPLHPIAADNPHLRRKIADYLGDGSGSTERMLGRASAYFPVFEHYLNKYGMPAELKYLAVAESMLVPGAVSQARAAGLWQLMPATAREMGLRVDGTVDERLDLYRSTEAAVLMLRDLYAQFGDWHLALAAYNCGPGRVRQAIRRAGGYTQYARVRPYLPRESRRYVAAYVAAAYATNYYGDHGLTPTAPALEKAGVRTLTVYQNLSLRRLSRAVDVAYSALRALNPKYVRAFVPASKGGYRLRVPADRAVPIQQYVWGRPNLVELPADADLPVAEQLAASLDYDPLALYLGVRPAALAHYRPPVAMAALRDRLLLAFLDRNGALAMN